MADTKPLPLPKVGGTAAGARPLTQNVPLNKAATRYIPSPVKPRKKKLAFAHGVTAYNMGPRAFPGGCRLRLDDERHELFAQNLAKGMPQSKAYVAAGFEASTSQSIRVNAHRLSRKTAVMKRVVQIQEAGALRAERAVGVTKGRVLQMLIESYDLATEKGQFAAAVPQRGVAR